MRKSYGKWIVAGICMGITVILFTSVARAADPITWKTHITWNKENVITAQVMEPWAKEIAERTNGRLKLPLYYSGGLGFKGPELLKALSANATECGVICLGHVEGDWADPSFMDLPGIYSSPTDMYKNGWLLLRKQFDNEFEKRWGIKLVMFISCDEQVVLSKKELRKLSDLKGQKIRSFSPALSSMLTGLGASALSIPFGEMYSAIERGVVDGACTGFMAHVSLHSYDVTKYGLWNVGLGGFASHVVGVPMKVWKALPADIQGILGELTDKYSALSCLQVAENMGGDSMKTLQNKGVTMTKGSSQDVEQARKLALSAVWPEWFKHATPLGKEWVETVQKGRK
jgi:TRAP-type transport system periplasmic protein